MAVLVLVVLFWNDVGASFGVDYGVSVGVGVSVIVLVLGLINLASAPPTASSL